MKYYIIAGEASGDLHAANLMKEIKRLQPNSEFRAWGGDLMQEQGATIVKHYRDLAFMGFIEVIANLKTILKNIDFCKQDIEEYQPDAVIFIDYPGFNLRIAEHVKKIGIKTIYYISPQIWAWKESRVHKIKKYIDKMLVILPFEKEFYAKHNYEVSYVGHPLLDAINEIPEDFKVFTSQNNLSEKPIIALLPGSRKQEINTMLPIMLSVVNDFKEYQFVIAGAPSQEKSFYETFVSKYPNVHLAQNQTYDLLRHSKAALVTSGTATLETALFKVPEVVCYKGSAVSYLIARQLVKVKYISLVNLIMDKELVKELIQSELHTKNLKTELTKLLTDDYRSSLLIGYQELIQKLGGKGASQKAAEEITAFIN
jgi:lipid-A-disaccharide synthase